MNDRTRILHTAAVVGAACLIAGTAMAAPKRMVETRDEHAAWFQSFFERNLKVLERRDGRVYIECARLSDGQGFLAKEGDPFVSLGDDHGHTDFTLLKVSDDGVDVAYKERFDHSSFGKDLITVDRGTVHLKWKTVTILSLAVIETPHPGDSPHEGYAGYYALEIRNVSRNPARVVAYGMDHRSQNLRTDAAWAYNAILVQYAYNPSEPPVWNRTATPAVKTLPLPGIQVLEPGGTFQMKVPIDVNKDMPLPFRFCARYSPKTEHRDFTKDNSGQSLGVWDGSLEACKMVGGITLNEEGAKQLAGRLANEELAKGNVKDYRGNPRTSDKFTWWHTGQKDGRWVLSRPVPSGVSAFVSFNLDGSDPQVRVEYSAD